MVELIKAVDMVRSIREAHYARIKDLSPEEKIKFFLEKARALHSELGRPEELPQNTAHTAARRSSQVKLAGRGTVRSKMNVPTARHTYFELEIAADSSDTEIWLGDDEGHLVQKEVGVLRSSLLPGEYVVEFGLGTACYPIRLRANSRYTQRGLQAGPPCERPIPTLPPD